MLLLTIFLIKSLTYRAYERTYITLKLLCGLLVVKILNIHFVKCNLLATFHLSVPFSLSPIEINILSLITESFSLCFKSL